MPRRAFLSARESRRIARRRRSQRKGSGARCIGRDGRLLRCGCARVLRLRAVGFGVRGCASGSSRSFWLLSELSGSFWFPFVDLVFLHTSGLFCSESTTEGEKLTGLSLLRACQLKVIGNWIRAAIRTQQKHIASLAAWSFRNP